MGKCEGETKKSFEMPKSRFYRLTSFIIAVVVVQA